MAALPECPVLVVLGLAPIGKKAVVHIDSHIASLVIGKLLGGGESAPEELKPLTETEQGVLQYLIIASLMEGLQTALFIGWTAFDQELIPLEGRGRWSGITMLTHGIIGVIAPILGGVIWNLNPDYIWWINLIGDAFIVLPLMIMIPDIRGKSAQAVREP